jgi:hypothetical protein
MKKTTLIPLLFLFTSCSDQSEKEASKNDDLSKDSLTVLTSFIKPPITGVDVSVEEFGFSAEQGDTLFPNSGSIILFPPNSLVDEKGNLIKGKVDVTYREFKDPIDFFVSGIPMNYVMNDTNYTFESSGMLEIKVTQHNVPVFVNPSKSPEVNLRSNNSDPEHNLYFLDTVQRKWIEKGKDLITNLNKYDKSRKETNTEPTVQNNVSVAKPIKASSGPVFEIEISPGDFPELDIYRNVKFEIDKNEKGYNPKDAEVEWNDVRATKSTKEGLYLITFSTLNKKVSYLARPVFESKDYAQALKAFDENNKRGQRLAAKKLEEEKFAQKKNDALEQAIQNREKENEKIRQLNLLIDARNKIIAENNEITTARNKQILAARANDRIFRSFKLPGFGIYNCDRPEREGDIYLTLLPTDQNHVSLSLALSVVSRGFNGVTSFSGHNIRINSMSDNAILSAVDGKCAYISFDEFKKYDFQPNEPLTVIMTVYDGRITSPEDIRTLVGL